MEGGILVQGYEWGPGVPKIILELEQQATEIGAENGAAISGSDPWLTEEKIDAIKDIPIWFIGSVDDAVADPKIYVLPSYRALVQAGAKNCWLSMFENVKGTDDPNASYIGHFSWVYLLNDQVTGVLDREAVRNSEDLELFGTTPSNHRSVGRKSICALWRSSWKENISVRR